jgi:hypothetical protein
MNTILLIIVILIVIWITYKSFSTNSTLSNNNNGKSQLIISDKDLDTSNLNSSNFTYSIWIYIDDWSYRYGQEKIILQRVDAQNNICPKISLGAFQNNLDVAINTYPNSTDSSINVSSSATQTHNCQVKNIPIQSWVHVLISVNGRTLDIYIDGKLVRTCVMPGVVKVPDISNVLITPNGGFSGSTSTIKYLANSTNPQDAWNMYKDGYNTGFMGQLFDKYKIKLSYLKDNKEQASIQL